MAKTSAERNAALRVRRKALGLHRWELWVTKEEKANLKPIIEQKLKELRETDNKK